MKHSQLALLFALAAGAFSQRLSTDGSCGPTNGGATCVNTCCSQYGWCGSTPLHCGTGCNPAFGQCGAPGDNSTPPPVVPPPANQQRSPDGSCGGANGFTCAGNPQGQCCSKWGWCGAGPEYCNGGCQNGFGTCNTPPAANSASAAASVAASPAASNAASGSVIAPSSGPVASAVSSGAAVSSAAAVSSPAAAASSAGASSVFGSSVVVAPSSAAAVSASASVAASSVVAASSSPVVAASSSAASAAPSSLPPGTYCGTNYNTEGNGTGNDTVDRPDITDPELCCQACNNTVNCVANAIQGNCVLLVRVSLDGGNGVPSAQCPLEQTVYPFVNPGFGIVYKGPCGIVPS